MTDERIQSAAHVISLHVESLVGDCRAPIERLETSADAKRRISEGSMSDIYLRNAASALRQQAAAIEDVHTRLRRNQL